MYGHAVVTFLERLDRFFAFKITLRHFGEPLYQDRTILGYALGFFFRIGRIFIGSLVYFFVIVLAVLLYVLWCLAPIYILIKIFL